MMLRFASPLPRHAATAPLAPFALCIALAAAPLGCGSSVEVSTGSGATGGAITGATGGAITGGAGGASTGGTGGATASGTGAMGTSLPECSKEVEDTVYPSHLGLSPKPKSPLSAVVVSVAPDSLQFSVGAGMPVQTFAWEGPPLDAVFKQGDSITVGTQQGWDYVAGSQVAAVHEEETASSPAVLPAVPMSKAPPREARRSRQSAEDFTALFEERRRGRSAVRAPRSPAPRPRAPCRPSAR
jgi:hypothetical protein